MVLNRYTLTLLLLTLVSSIALGQKIKYKDLFVLLQAKQYDQAEPFLKKYLKDNQDNPNAFLFMGYIYEAKSKANNVLKETEMQSTNTDSAILFFNRAFKEIDERELKKNDEYYQTYSRRDLRTGKFGLKLSDVQFDLEQRMKELRDKGQKVLAVKSKFTNTKRIYENCSKLFKSIAEENKNQKEFYLRADDKLAVDLRALSRRYDSCVLLFNEYKSGLQGLEKTGYNPELDPKEILDFTKEGYSELDFYQDELKIWDYKRWALSNLEVIEKEVWPLTENMVKLDGELNKLREIVKKDSVSVLSQLSTMTQMITTMGLRKFDPKAMPGDVFLLKMHELEYGSELAQTRKLRDTSDLILKQGLYRKQIAFLSKVDSMASLLLQRDFEYETANYKSFVTSSYGSASVLRNTIKSTGDFAVAEKAIKEKAVLKIDQVLNWVYDQADSIPVSPNVASKKYFPLSIVSNSHTYGLTFTNAVSAYFYTITPTRQAALKSNHKIDSTIFRKAQLSLIKSISVRDASRDEFYVLMYSEEKLEEKTPAVVYKITRTDGLAWSNVYSLEGIPMEVAYGKENGELSIKISTNSGNKVVVIQKDGKQL